MILHSLNAIFIHIRRTGGSSTEWALRNYSEGQVIKRKDTISLKNDDKHETALQIRRRIGREKFDQYFKFSIVRNPWDWVLSHYLRFYMRQKKYSFAHYVKNVMPRKQRTNKTQLSHLSDREGKIIVDSVGRFEDLNAYFGDVCRTLGITVELSHICISKHKCYQYYYNNETRKIVEDLFTDDIEYFNYRFDS